MASLGMGMNGVLMGVPLGGYLDFAPEPPAPSATPVSVTEHVDLQCPPSNDTRDLSNICVLDSTPNGEVRIKFETLRSLAPSDGLNLNNHHMSLHTIHQLDPVQSSIEQHNNSISSSRNSISNSIDNKSTNDDQDHQMIDDDQTVAIKQESNSQNMIITPEIVSLMSSTQMDIYGSDTSEDTKIFANNDSPTNQQSDAAKVPKTWTQEDMESALDALRNHNMSLTKASITFGIPSTTLWQRAHRLGIDTPKKEGPTKTWSEDSLNSALEALRTGQISANKASKAYGIPSSTLYKIARREGIRLAAPFNAAPTTWTQEDLERALEAIRAGHTSVQKASTEFGIPTGTLYGRCKREGIELSRSNPTPWSEDAMMDALESVRVGQMSINQAAIHYNLPYSSLYGRFKRGKYEAGSVDNMNSSQLDQSPDNSRNFQYSPTGPATIQHQIHPTHQSIVVTSPSLLHHHQQQQHPSNHHNIMYHHVQTLHPSMQHERS